MQSALNRKNVKLNFTVVHSHPLQNPTRRCISKGNCSNIHGATIGVLMVYLRDGKRGTNPAMPT